MACRPPRCPDDRVADATVLALSGILDLVGRPDAAPVALGGHQASYVAGLAAFSGLAAALCARDAGAAGETVTVSATEASLWANWKSFAERLYLGRGPTREGRLAEWQALPCTDGHAALVYLDRDWPLVVRLIGDARLERSAFDTREGRRASMAQICEIVRPWFAARSRAEIFELAKAAGLPIAPVIGVRELIDDAQLRGAAFFAPPAGRNCASHWQVPTVPTVWNGRRFAPAAAQHTSAGGCRMSHYPLAGCRVLDLGIITAGASTTALLADLGADVIKVESSAYIDPFRAWDRGLGAADWWNQSRFFAFTNRNKRDLALDLKSPRGRELFLDLVAGADVVVENFRRGVLERLKLDYATLAARNPKLILVSVTSQGETGPDATAASFGSTLEATSGLADLTRDDDGTPLISGILLNYPDQIVSIYAAGVTALAVMEQRRTGRGARLDISQRELASFLIGEHILAASAGAIAAPPDVAEPPATVARRRQRRTLAAVPRLLAARPWRRRRASWRRTAARRSMHRSSRLHLARLDVQAWPCATPTTCSMP